MFHYGMQLMSIPKFRVVITSSTKVQSRLDIRDNNCRDVFCFTMLNAKFHIWYYCWECHPAHWLFYATRTTTHISFVWLQCWERKSISESVPSYHEYWLNCEKLIFHMKNEIHDNKRLFLKGNVQNFPTFRLKLHRCFNLYKIVTLEMI